MAKIAKTFRLEQSTVDLLAELCTLTGHSATSIVEAAIKLYDTEKHAVNTSEKALEVALAQVDRLQAELERTHAALERAQDATKAAQALQGAAEQRAQDAEKRILALPEPPDPDEWMKKGLLDRILKR
jgi:exonuclease VII small subunit